MRRLTLLGLVVGFVVGAAVSSCGPAQPAPTSLFLTVTFNPSLGTQTLFFRFLDKDGLEAVPRAYRPEEHDGGVLASPQTVRVYLTDKLAGARLTTAVQGLDENGVEVESAEKTVTPALHASTDVDLRLAPFDGGAQTDGGLEFDAGLPRDGGFPDGGCQCGGACCDGTGRCVAPFAVPTAPVPGFNIDNFAVACGPSNSVCTAYCALGKANRCSDGACKCGNGPACGDGLRCQVSGNTAQCVCDAASACQGCCSSGACLAGSTLASCGSGGLQCEVCDSASRVCSFHTCQGRCSLQSDKCCTGNGDTDIRFPTCRTPAGNCQACDVTRSSACDPALGCVCGTNAGQCAQGKLCVQAAPGVFRCSG